MKKEKCAMSKSAQNIQTLREGAKDGIPIGLGYLAVAFSLGIAAKKAGLTAFQGLLVSALCSASAGEYVGFTLIAAGATFFELAIATFVANARYLLMSCALSQKAPGLLLRHRLMVAFGITDEIFGISISRRGALNPFYNYGAMLFAIPCWAIGTALGVVAGNLLPMRLVSAFSVALYGMFLAVIVPPAKTDKVVLVLIAVCFLFSFAAGCVPLLSSLSEGTRTILLTVVLSALAAILFPKDEEVTAK